MFPGLLHKVSRYKYKHHVAFEVKICYILARCQPASEGADEELHHCHGVQSPADSHAASSLHAGTPGAPAASSISCQIVWVGLIEINTKIGSTPSRQHGILRLNAFTLTAVQKRLLKQLRFRIPALPPGLWRLLCAAATDVWGVARPEEDTGVALMRRYDGMTPHVWNRCESSCSLEPCRGRGVEWKQVGGRWPKGRDALQGSGMPPLK